MLGFFEKLDFELRPISGSSPVRGMSEQAPAQQGARDEPVADHGGEPHEPERARLGHGGPRQERVRRGLDDARPGGGRRRRRPVARAQRHVHHHHCHATRLFLHRCTLAQSAERHDYVIPGHSTHLAVIWRSASAMFSTTTAKTTDLQKQQMVAC